LPVNLGLALRNIGINFVLVRLIEGDYLVDKLEGEAWEPTHQVLGRLSPFQEVDYMVQTDPVAVQTNLSVSVLRKIVG
jgi:hypothetical protein